MFFPRTGVPPPKDENYFKMVPKGCNGTIHLQKEKCDESRRTQVADATFRDISDYLTINAARAQRVFDRKQGPAITSSWAGGRKAHEASSECFRRRRQHQIGEVGHDRANK